jgi:hypothetical protein
MMQDDGWCSAPSVFHVKHLDLVREPLRTIKRLYDGFGMPFGQEAETQLTRFLGKHSDGDYGANHYTLERYGMDRGRLRHRFSDYTAFFDVELEG